MTITCIEPPAWLGVVPGQLGLDAGRLCFHPRLLGLRAGVPGIAVRAGVLPAGGVEGAVLLPPAPRAGVPG